MNKLLLFIVIIETIALVFVLAKDVTFPTGFAVQEGIEDSTQENNPGPVFSTYTKAVCSKKEDLTVCNDKVFVKCGDMKHMLPDVLNSMAVKGDWEDPRRNN